MSLIAVVDPDADARERTLEALRGQGHETVGLADAEAALEAFQAGDPIALLVTRLELPGRDGLALTRELRGAFDRRRLPILLGVPDPNEEVTVRALDAGVTDVLSLPFQPASLLAKVHVLLKMRGASQLSETARLDETVNVAPPRPDDLDLAPPAPRRHFAHYELTDELGRGGMGTVYKAIDRGSGAVVALKILHTRARDETFIARFLREIRILEELRCEHVVRVIASGEVDGNHYMAMELIEGDSAKQRLEVAGPFSGRTLLNVLRGVVAALAALHSHGLVHRDVKPANILLGEDDRAILVDFGLAKQHGDRALTHTGEALGTPYYLSPEVVRGGEADIRSDLYALGVTVFELATAEKAFPGQTALEVFRNIFYGSTPDLQDHRPDLPLGLRSIVRRLIARRPQDRPADPVELLDELEQLHERLRKRTERLTDPTPPPM